jgi:hypothetical protein
MSAAGADMSSAVSPAAQLSLLELDSADADKGASLIAIRDSAEDFSASNVETAIAELHTAATATVDHGATTGRSDDDHTQYTLANGTRAFTGVQSMGSNRLTGVSNADGASDAMPLLQILSLFMPYAGGTFVANVTLNDDVLLRFGTGGDSTIKYDGTDTIWDPAAVGSGNLKVKADIEFDDDDGIKFGTGDDAKISYNGTNLIINPDVAGSGICRVEASFRATGNVRSDTAFRLGSATGLTGVREFFDGGGGAHTVTIQGGIITAWSS